MRQLTKFIPYLSVLLNVYFLGSWIYVFNKFALQSQKTNYFIQNFLFGLPVSGVSIFLIFFSIFSLVILFIYKLDYELLRIILIVVQFIFLMIHLWQYL
jgi:hypothetical protein